MVVVFPLVPVTPTTGSVSVGLPQNSSETVASAARASATTICGVGRSSRRSATSATAPFATASAAQSCPSTPEPRTQKKTLPGRTRPASTTRSWTTLRPSPTSAVASSAANTSRNSTARSSHDGRHASDARLKRRGVSSSFEALPPIERGVSMSAVTRTPLPLILVRGFGGLGVEDEKRIAYQGFNDGTVYPRKRGENYIYEGMILRFMKSEWQYQDATNVIGYYGKPVVEPTRFRPSSSTSTRDCFFGRRACCEARGTRSSSTRRWRCTCSETTERSAADAVGLPLLRPGRAQVRDLRAGAGAADRLHPRARGGEGRGAKPKVNIIAHSMGGLIVREAIQSTYPDSGERPRTTSTRS